MADDDLRPELDRLRLSGLVHFEPDTFPAVARAAVAAGYGRTAALIDVASVADLFRRALRSRGDSDLTGSTARLFSLGQQDRLGDAHATRMRNAARVASDSGMTVRGYAGTARHSRRDEDLEVLALGIEDVARQTTTPPPVMPVEAPPPASSARTNSSLVDRVEVEPPPEIARHFGLIGDMEDWLTSRRALSLNLWRLLEEERDTQIDQYTKGGFPEPLSDKLCMFASGSYGRDEAMEWSDLDMFLVDDVGNRGRLGKFEEASARTLIDRCRFGRDIQSFSRGGYYQITLSFQGMLSGAARQDDTPRTMTTGRALLLCNSKPFWNETLYHEMRETALDDYWRDAVSVNRLHVPLFLINDLRRVWQNMVVDFDHFYPAEQGRSAEWLHFRHIAGLKLRMAQKLSLYSAILGLLERSTNSGLVRADAELVLNRTTQQRLEELMTSRVGRVGNAADKLRTLYSHYLAFSWCKKDEMLERVEDPTDWKVVKQHFAQAQMLLLAMLFDYYQDRPDVAGYALL